MYALVNCINRKTYHQVCLTMVIIGGTYYQVCMPHQTVVIGGTYRQLCPSKPQGPGTVLQQCAYSVNRP